MPFSLLLAMQASGMVIDWFGTKSQQQMGNMGLKIQQAGIEANIYQTRVETEDASLRAMQDLRKNMGTQIAVMSARGSAMVGGSSAALFNESISNFNTDERMRRMNQLGRENELKAGGSIAKLNNQAQQSKLWSGFASRSLNTFGTTYNYWDYMKTGGKAQKSPYSLTPID
jgi:hypothetical protein